MDEQPRYPSDDSTGERDQDLISPHRFDAYDVPAYSAPGFEGDRMVQAETGPSGLVAAGGRATRIGLVAGMAAVAVVGISIGVGRQFISGNDGDVRADSGVVQAEVTAAATVTATASVTVTATPSETVTVTSTPTFADLPPSQSEVAPRRRPAPARTQAEEPAGDVSAHDRSDGFSGASDAEKREYVDALVRDYLRAAVDRTITRKDMERYFMPRIDWYNASGKSRESLYESLNRPKGGGSTKFDEPVFESFTANSSYKGAAASRIKYYLTFTKSSGVRGAVYVSYVLIVSGSDQPRIAKVSEEPA